MFKLSVCAETVFRHLPFEERVRRVTEAGFLVEFWKWSGRDLSCVVDRSEPVSTFVGCTAGSMVHPDGVNLFLDGVEKSIAAAHKLRCRQMILLTGEMGPNGEVEHPIASNPATLWITAYKTLYRVAELAEKHDVTYNLEHLNTKLDHPGYPLALVEDAAKLISEVGSSRIKLLLDLYHTQIQQGDLIDTIHKHGHLIGYVHVADVPGRHEPGTGEINYPGVARALREVGYEGVIGLEAFPAADEGLAFARFREAFD